MNLLRLLVLTLPILLVLYNTDAGIFLEYLDDSYLVPIAAVTPDVLTRAYIRYSLTSRLREEAAKSEEEIAQYLENLKMRQLAQATAEANEQHYEVPTEYFLKTLGPRLKYSGSFYENEDSTLADAEIVSLENYIRRSQLWDPSVKEVLDLGCGWGSFLLYAAEKYPNISFTGLSNSATQKKLILARAEERGLKNVQVLTQNIKTFDLGEAKFDRIVSIEMFEHMKNYDLLMKKVFRALKENGKLFVQVFCHRDYFYDFEDSWMARNFFSGGTMPNADFLTYFLNGFELENQYFENGVHYERMNNDWLKNQDNNKDAIMKVFTEAYGEGAEKAFLYWRLFYMACAELFGYADGTEWMITHLLLKK